MTGALPLLVGDLGATNLRLALVDSDAPPRAFERLAAPDTELGAVLAGYLARHGAEVRGCALGVAGRVRGQPRSATVDMTNRQLSLDAARLSATLGTTVELHNDVAALAATVPAMEPSDLEVLDGLPLRVDAPVLVVAVGTGFGAALATPSGEVIATEAGHAELPASAPRMAGGTTATAVTIESALSGPGLARWPGAPAAAQAAFIEALGRTCANLVLATGAWGGVLLAGGVIDGLAPRLDSRRLRAALAGAGPFAGDLAALPLGRVRAPDATLRGLVRLWGRHWPSADQRAAKRR